MAEEEAQLIGCPKCKEKFAVVASARRQAETVLTYELTLEPGHMVSASTVGESISAFERLMKVMSKDMGGTCLTLIKDMSLKDNKIRFDFLIVTNESALYEKNAPKRATRSNTRKEPTPCAT